jgi:hypothetical protein
MKCERVLKRDLGRAKVLAQLINTVELKFYINLHFSRLFFRSTNNPVELKIHEKYFAIFDSFYANI